MTTEQAAQLLIHADTLVFAAKFALFTLGAVLGALLADV